MTFYSNSRLALKNICKIGIFVIFIFIFYNKKKLLHKAVDFMDKLCCKMFANIGCICTCQFSGQFVSDTDKIK
jgi:hypothetical protein